MNLPRSCRCSSLVSSRYPWFFRYITNRVISATPATKVLANVYQLYMVEYQCASILISHSQGTVDITVNTNHTMNNAAHTVFLKIYLRPASMLGNGLLSSSRDNWRILRPSTIHSPMVSMVQII